MASSATSRRTTTLRLGVMAALTVAYAGTCIYCRTALQMTVEISTMARSPPSGP